MFAEYNESYNESNISNGSWKEFQLTNTFKRPFSVRQNSSYIFESTIVVACSSLYSKPPQPQHSSTVTDFDDNNSTDNSTNGTCGFDGQLCVHALQSSATLGGLTDDVMEDEHR